MRSLDELLPVRGPARLVESITASDDTSTSCVARVAATSPFAKDGAVPVHVALEVAAQTAGIHGGRRHDAPPHEGYLVVVRDTTFRVDHFAAGATLHAEVHTDGEAAELSLFRFVVRDEATVIAEGQLGMYATFQG